MRRPKTSHLNAHQLQPRAFAECSETFCHFCIHSFVWRMPRRGSPCTSVGKVCKGFRLAVFVWFTLLFSLFFCCCSCCCSCYFFSFGFEMNVSIHFTLHCVPSGARHAKRTAGLGSQSHPHSRSRSRSQSDSDSSRECLEAKSASVAEQGLPLTARHHYNLLICFVKHQTTKASTKNKEKKKEITTRKRNESETARERIKLKWRWWRQHADDVLAWKKREEGNIKPRRRQRSRRAAKHSAWGSAGCGQLMLFVVIAASLFFLFLFSAFVFAFKQQCIARCAQKGE